MWQVGFDINTVCLEKCGSLLLQAEAEYDKLAVARSLGYRCLVLYVLCARISSQRQHSHPQQQQQPQHKGGGKGHKGGNKHKSFPSWNWGQPSNGGGKGNKDKGKGSKDKGKRGHSQVAGDVAQQSDAKK